MVSGTRTGLLMKLGVFVVGMSVLFAMVEGSPLPTGEVVDRGDSGGDPSLLSADGRLGELNGTELSLANFIKFTGGCVFGGLVLGTVSCVGAVASIGELLGFEGLADPVITVAQGASAFAGGLLAFLTFDVPGAPLWFRVPMAAGLNVGVFYVIVAIARGI